MRTLASCMEVNPARRIEHMNGIAYIVESDYRNCIICVIACLENAFKIK